MLTTSIDPPVWPLPALNGYDPIPIIADPNDPSVDLAYDRAPHNVDDDEEAAGEKGTSRYFLPSLMPIYAVYSGVIVYAGRHDRGCAIVIDHENGWMTFYSLVQHMFARPTDARPPHKAARIKTGDLLGLAGRTNSRPFEPLRFELWKHDEGDGDYKAVDPTRFMRDWRVLPWSDRRFKTVGKPA